ncbi:MAG TPA: ATP-binding protein [Novosphingobium sp.]|nr:ATP-binding protein [Novosphingobium sp.]
MPLPRAEHARRSRWRGVSLTTRILAVNVIVLGLMGFSLFYLDSYRKQLVRERFAQASSDAAIIADALALTSPEGRAAVLSRIAARQHMRLQIFGPHGEELADSRPVAGPGFVLINPHTQPWYMKAARTLDRAMDAAVNAPPIPDYADIDDTSGWPEVEQARSSNRVIVWERYAPDRSPVITTGSALGHGGEVLFTRRNGRDITQNVRDARQTLAIVVGVALLVTVFLSLFLARTIVQPLRMLVRAAVRVRLGRDRAVVVPRLPQRGDEIGLLARALADMSEALRQRIDAVESFAADVAHEIKNPLASLRSALDTLDKVEDPELRRQLADIAAHDVQRIDRLVTEIADASRIDAELSRTTFELLDMAALARALVGARAMRGVNGGRKLRVFAPDGQEAPIVAGDPARLERVLENLLDNAVSFSPEGGTITITIRTEGAQVELEVTDEGPGIAAEARERVFERFHSLRPAGEDFGHHSGLGLAIARTIIEAHDGTLVAEEPLPGAPGRPPGARLVIRLPAYSPRGSLLG